MELQFNYINASGEIIHGCAF